MKINLKNNFLILSTALVCAAMCFSLKSFVLAQFCTQPLEPAVPSNLIRVGLSDNSFSKLEHESVEIGASSDYKLIDKATSRIISVFKAAQTVKITRSNSTFKIRTSENLVTGNINGPLSLKADNGNLKIIGLSRVGKPAFYRGEIELTPSPSKSNKFSIVNILPLEDYLKGVVPNELPVYFGLEALKAQTIAARNYALRPRIKSYNSFDVCDSVQCQVYFGANTEQPLSNQAIADTKGLYAIYNGDLILALYSSTAGGYTENYENAFTEPGSTVFPAPVLYPYLKGKPDIECLGTLNKEQDAEDFYMATPPGFDINSSFYRWIKTWSASELSEILKKTLLQNSKSGFVCPKFDEDSDFGKLNSISVLRRGVSGKAMIVNIETSTGNWQISKELIIRSTFKHNKKMLPSANVIFKNNCDDENNLVEVVAYGGGYGHGVGLSQYGAGFMSKNGYSFDRILQHYYDGIAIGTYPIVMVSNISKKPVTQTFIALNSKADLVIDNSENVECFKVKINETEMAFDETMLALGENRFSIDNFLKNGENTITFYPPIDKDKINEKKVKAWIEVYKRRNDG